MFVSALLVAVIMPETDMLLAGELPNWFEMAPTTARSTLTSITGAMFSLLGVVFSITVVALSITTSQLGPRLLRNFLKDSITQVTLGLCVGTATYCLLLLRRIDEFDGTVFVPRLSLTLATLLAVGTLIAIIFFIHRITHSIQASNVVSDVARDIDDAIDRLYPEPIGSDGDQEERPEESPMKLRDLAMGDGPGTIVLSAREGYLQAVDAEGLMTCATQNDWVIQLLVTPGDFIYEGTPLAVVVNEKEVEERLQARLQQSFLVGNLRTPRQDIICAINELVEVALRALSPGINDPFTAIACLDRLTGSLRRLALRKPPVSERNDEAGDLRVLVKHQTFADAVDAALHPIRRHANDSTMVKLHLFVGIESLADVAKTNSHLDILKTHADLVHEGNQCEQASGDQTYLSKRYEGAITHIDKARQRLKNDKPALMPTA